jgi:hypothetical protein
MAIRKMKGHLFGAFSVATAAFEKDIDADIWD